MAWAGDDQDGSGVARYDVYVSVDGGPYVLWQAGTSATQALFAGQVGRTYAFYSVATDWVGNREVAPSEPDAATTVVEGGLLYLPLVVQGGQIEAVQPSSRLHLPMVSRDGGR